LNGCALPVPIAEFMTPPELPKRKFTGFELIPGKTYRVTTAFVDHDGLRHPVGETWRFVSHNFVPYHDGLTLFVEREGQQESCRMECRNESQGPIVSAFSDFVEEL
jgi:hypothetical protein